MHEYQGRLRLVIKHYPYRYRDYSALAAQASEAARAQGKFWEMHDLMLSRKQLDRSSLAAYARELNLDVTRFLRELDSQMYLPQIKADFALARQLDFFQTPTFVINGRVLVGERPIEMFRQLIDQALAEVAPQ
ncbi:MAG: thioredoxin domain-containing protein [Deltaproteobacteria bacterium]|nr:thioredoxin domain-containing protein [Deltaproteobacteria bacterium]NCP01965.1 thioredoxin domain-containing protein [Deltaproteobacteria bacterium]NCP77641.1 thioredoxin domain-containing protein [Desulfuromonadales bacterium]